MFVIQEVINFKKFPDLSKIPTSKHTHVLERHLCLQISSSLPVDADYITAIDSRIHFGRISLTKFLFSFHSDSESLPFPARSHPV